MGNIWDTIDDSGMVLLNCGKRGFSCMSSCEDKEILEAEDKMTAVIECNYKKNIKNLMKTNIDY